MKEVKKATVAGTKMTAKKGAKGAEPKAAKAGTGPVKMTRGAVKGKDMPKGEAANCYGKKGKK